MKFQHNFAYLAFIWLFLEAASLAVIGSGRAEGTEEFLEEKNRTVHCSFHLNCRKLYLKCQAYILKLKKLLSVRYYYFHLTYLQIVHMNSPDIICKYHSAWYANVTFIFMFHRNPWKINRKILIYPFYKWVDLR